MAEMTAPPEILIVEDSLVEAELLRRSLARAGYRVTIAKNGEEGLQAARSRRPALVVSDIRMPLMNGYELCRAIKYDETLWNVPVILLTMLSEPEDIMEAINSGADGYVIKPFVEASLLERIRALLATPARRKRAEERRSEMVEYNGRPYTIVGGGQQILNLLFSVYENILIQNRDLTRIQTQLNLLNESLEEQVRERTAALAESETKFRTILEGALDGILVADAQTHRFLAGNHAICDMLGYNLEELCAFGVEDIHPSEALPEVIQQFERQLRGEIRLAPELPVKRRDGTVFFADITSSPMTLSGRVCLIGIFHDVTERRQADQALRYRLRTEETISAITTRLVETSDMDKAIDDSLADLGRLTDVSRAYVFLLREGGTVMDNTHEWCAPGVSRQIQNLKGLPTATYPWWMSKLHRREIIHIADVSKLPPEATAEKETLESQDIQSLLVFPLFIQEKLAGFVGFDDVEETGKWSDSDLLVLRTVSEILGTALGRQRAVSELQEYRDHLEEMVRQRTTELSKTSQRLEYLVVSSPTVIYACKAGGDYPVTFVSANVGRLLGYEPRDFTEAPGFRLGRIHPEDAPRVLGELGRLAEKGQQSHEYRFRLKDGSYRWLRDELKLTRDAEGRPLEAVGYLTDITAHKEIDHLKDELISTVSHELRTPLTTLRGFVELLGTRDFPPEKQRQFLGIIGQETVRLGHMIDDFLDIQRIESGRQEYRFESLDAVALLRDVAELFQRPDPRHTMRVEAPAGLPCVRADGERIRQVLENLIANALKFSPAGGDILLRARVVGNEIETSVTDPGIGIPAEEIPKLFVKFYRVEHPGMPHFPGTGLGLALVREIAQKHGGRVWVESELGRGSTFYFTLPVEGA